MITLKASKAQSEKFDHLPWGACVLDQQLVVHEWNTTLSNWTHVSREEAVGSNLGDRYPHLHNSPYRSKLEHVFQTGAPAVFSAALHKRFIPIRLTEGLMVQKTVVRPLESDAKLALVLIENTTAQYRQMEELRRESKHLKKSMREVVEAQQALARVTAGLEFKNQELLHAKSRLENSSRYKSEFLANMSHELRTPMNAIMGFTRRLKKKLKNSIGVEDFDSLETIDRNAHHLMSLINDVLDLSKIEAGRMEIHRSEFDVVIAIEETIHQVISLIDDKPISLVTQLPKQPISICADRMKVIQMVTNLLSNAIKYTDEGKISVTASVEKDADLGSVVEISVRDTGIGIKEDDRIRLFSRFTQLDGSTTRQVGGTGLGLYITQQYVRLHGGSIGVKSNWGQGSEFTLRLPISSAMVYPARLTDDDSPAMLETEQAPLPDNNLAPIQVTTPSCTEGDL